MLPLVSLLCIGSISAVPDLGFPPFPAPQLPSLVSYHCPQFFSAPVPYCSGADAFPDPQFLEDSDGSLLGGPTGEASPKPPVYRTDTAGSALPAAMHNISDLEVQGSLVKVW